MLSSWDSWAGINSGVASVTPSTSFLGSFLVKGGWARKCFFPPTPAVSSSPSSMGSPKHKAFCSEGLRPSELNGASYYMAVWWSKQRRWCFWRGVMPEALRHLQMTRYSGNVVCIQYTDPPIHHIQYVHQSKHHSMDESGGKKVRQHRRWTVDPGEMRHNTR